jgi:hypothetical protein
MELVSYDTIGHQVLDLQVDALTAVGDTRLHREVDSGAKAERRSAWVGRAHTLRDWDCDVRAP